MGLVELNGIGTTLSMSNKDNIKRIFLTGPPGSMWSSPDRIIRRLIRHIDQTDINEDTVGMINIQEPGQPLHLSPYINWGGKMGDWPLHIGDYDRAEIERVIDSYYDPVDPDPSRGTLLRIHKSHHWSYNLDHIKTLFPEACILVVTQEAWKCAVWWEHCGGHETKVGGYEAFDKDYEAIWREINWVKAAVERWADKENLKWFTPTLAELESRWGRTRKSTGPPEVEWDGIQTLLVPPDRGRNLSNTVKWAAYNPWKPDSEPS